MGALMTGRTATRRTVNIEDGERRPKIAKHAAKHASNVGADKGNAIFVAKIVNADGLREGHVGHHDNLMGPVISRDDDPPQTSKYHTLNCATKSLVMSPV